MSHVLTAHSGPYTLEVRDTTGNAPNLGTVRTSEIRPQWGQLQRTLNEGILPCRFSVIANDPTDELRDLFRGAFNEKDYIAEVTGPPGPNDTQFNIELYPKQFTQTNPLSKRAHPDKTRLTFYDGLSRNKDPDVGTYDRGPGLGPTIRTVLQEVFTHANENLFVWAGIPVSHETLGWPTTGSGYGPDDLDKIRFSKRSEENWSSWWDVLKDLTMRYGLLVFQDPYDRGDNGRPRWKVINRALVGSQADGVTTGSAAFNGPEESETLTKDEVQLQEDKGFLEVSGGEEYEEAHVFEVIEDLVDPGTNDDFVSTVVGGDNILRDENFTIENTNTTRPFYGESQRVSILSATNELELDPDSGTSQDAYWRSEPFHVGEQLVIGQLTYSFELTAGDPQSGAEVRVDVLNEDGTTRSSFTGGTGTAVDINFKASGGLVRVAVFVPFDTASNPVYEYGQDPVKLWRQTNGRTNDSESDVETVRYSTENAGLITTDISGVADMELESVPISGTGDRMTVSVYRDQLTDEDVYTAGELIKKLRFATRPPETKTLRTTVRDHVLGPNTRILVEGPSGLIDRRLVPSGGRTVHLRDGYTEIADIETPF